MKANKLFAVALAALTLVGLASCNKDKDKEEVQDTTTTTLTLTPTSLNLKVGETGTIKANITVETWASKDEEIATVKDGVVTAVAKGETFITATAKGTTKTCIVTVTEEGGSGGGGESGGEKTITATHIWPVVLDGVTYEKYKSLVVGDFRVNDVDNHLYIWASGETYAAGDGTGKNYFGNTEGYVSLTVAAPADWSGGGFCIENADAITAMKTLQQALVANPDKFFLHIGIKAANDGNHQFYTFGTAETSFAIGKATIEKGEVIGDFPRDGEWYGFDIPLAKFANVIGQTEVKSGINILCFLSGATKGAQLNLDAVYFYEK